MSAEAHSTIRNISASAPVQNPSPQALFAHIGDLEQELRDADFRLQFLYRQRLAILELLTVAKGRAEKLKE